MGGTDARETARIYDLAAFRRARTAQLSAEGAKPERLPVSGGGAWYHEAALREEDRSRRT